MSSSITIGVIVPGHIDLGRQVLLGVRAWCNQHAGSRMVLISEWGYSPQINPGNVPFDCIVAHVFEREAVDHLSRLCPHLVITSNRHPMSNCVQVISDDEAVGRQGAEYLISLGYRTLAFITPKVFKFAEDRERGFTAHALAAGIPVHVFEASSQPQYTAVIEEIRALRGPVAAMAASDLHARWLIEQTPDPTKVVPEEIAVLGVDDDSLQASLTPVPISSVRLAGERIGYEAADLGMRLSRGAPRPDIPVRIAPRNIVTRRSTGALAIRDRTVARVIHLIRERMGEIADAGDLVRTMEIPRRTLEVRFRKATGRTLAHALASARIDRARELLATTDLSVKEIAFLVGFSEPRMLSIVFKRVSGELPSEYRTRVNPAQA